jgi:hypothetical protein
MNALGSSILETANLCASCPGTIGLILKEQMSFVISPSEVDSELFLAQCFISY